MRIMSLLIILVLLFAALPAFSAYIPGPKRMTITFNLSGFYDDSLFGFTEEIPTDYDSISNIDTWSMYVREVEEFEYTHGNQSVYAWWRISIPSRYSLSLYAEDKLSSDSGASMDWQVSWETEDETVTIGGENGYGIGNSKELYRNSSNLFSREIGYKELTFDVDIPDNAVPDNYTGRLVMRLATL